MKRFALSIILCCSLSACKTLIEADILLAGGMVYSGEDISAYIGDVAIRGEHIVYAGKPSARVKALKVIDVTGQIIAPGFIDPHTHSLTDLQSEDNFIRRNNNYRFQGVTTVVNGNDGFGGPNVAEITADLVSRGIGTNTALFVGHGATRSQIMRNENREPTDKELEDMKSLVEQGMKAGALGLSTGLFYAPGSFSNTEEVIELSKIAAKYDGIYDSHIRDEATYNIGLEAAIDEALEIGLAAEIPVHIAHIKALGVDVWGKSKPIIESINAARANGQRVTADQYPWGASGTRISNALLPRWVKSGSRESYMARLEDVELRAKILPETRENLRRRGGPKAILVTKGKSDWQGLTLDQIALQNGFAPAEMAIEIARQGDARIASFNMNEDDIVNFMRQPWVMTSSDGSSGHPRKYASFPRKFETYVKDQNLMEIGTFIHRSTGLTALTFGLCDRGFLRENYKADIVVFDPEQFRQVADFQTPEKLSEGVTHLFVNGEAVISNGQSLPNLPGRVVKRCRN